MSLKIVATCQGFGGFLGHMSAVKNAIRKNQGVEITTVDGNFLFIPVNCRSDVLINPQLKNAFSTTTIVLRDRKRTLLHLRDKLTTITLTDHGRPFGVFLHQDLARPESYTLNDNLKPLRQGSPVETSDAFNSSNVQTPDNSLADFFTRAVETCGSDGTGHFSITRGNRKYTLIVENNVPPAPEK